MSDVQFATDAPLAPSPDKEAAQADFFGGSIPKNGLALCLSGGGYRAMLYHAGALIRLNECGLLSKITHISSVSGGSITAAKLGAEWNELAFDKNGRATNLMEKVIQPLIRFASVDIDIRAALEGRLPSVYAANVVQAAYASKDLLGSKTMQDLPGRVPGPGKELKPGDVGMPGTPAFIFTATNLGTKTGWALSKQYAKDWRVGRIEKPDFPLAQAVAASSAFPPWLAPMIIDLSRYKIEKTPRSDLHKPPFTQVAELVDGGVYDNLGVRSVERWCHTVMISDAGKSIPAIGRPSHGLIGIAFNCLNIQESVIAARDLEVLEGLQTIGLRERAYWNIGKPLGSYGGRCPVQISDAGMTAAANISTRLARFTPYVIQLAMATGYASADAGLHQRGLVPADAPPADINRLPVVPDMYSLFRIRRPAQEFAPS